MHLAIGIASVHSTIQLFTQLSAHLVLNGKKSYGKINKDRFTFSTCATAVKLFQADKLVFVVNKYCRL